MTICAPVCLALLVRIVTSTLMIVSPTPAEMREHALMATTHIHVNVLQGNTLITVISKD